ncbi:uncharacterized protein LOC108667120 isoform X1 [Hyalella azteca]|uniref:Uncharacterized protein LOC108667120 isoform X1 n=1 Tax=Hyalella azteca TaxID=294128 RepID=A0A979FL83_HYAAZ|nr:uncharacterized protein LOC108667120 isoform X1 [Hyalella azteca]
MDTGNEVECKYSGRQMPENTIIEASGRENINDMENNRVQDGFESCAVNNNTSYQAGSSAASATKSIGLTGAIDDSGSGPEDGSCRTSHGTSDFDEIPGVSIDESLIQNQTVYRSLDTSEITPSVVNSAIDRAESILKNKCSFSGVRTTATGLSFSPSCSSANFCVSSSRERNKSFYNFGSENKLTIDSLSESKLAISDYSEDETERDSSNQSLNNNSSEAHDSFSGKSDSSTDLDIKIMENWSALNLAGEESLHVGVHRKNVLSASSVNTTRFSENGTLSYIDENASCELDGDRVKFIRNISLSTPNWDDELWKEHSTHPLITSKKSKKLIKKKYGAPLVLKPFPIHGRHHSDLLNAGTRKFGLLPCPDLPSFNSADELFRFPKPIKLLKRSSSFPETRPRFDQLKTIFSNSKIVSISTPSLNKLPSRSPESTDFVSKSSGISLVKVGRDEFDQSTNGIVGDSFLGKKATKILDIQTTKVTEIPMHEHNFEGEDHSTTIARERVSNDQVQEADEDHQPEFQQKQRHVEPPKYGHSGFYVLPKVAVVFPLRDVPASDTGEGDSRVPDAASHAEFGRSSPAGEPLHPASVTSLLASSKPVSPAKNKASSKHSSKHSSPIKTLSTVSVNNVADIDHTDSVDSDDQSSRVSTGLGSLEVVVCPVQKSHHVGREIVNTVYAIPIDSLFTLLFTNSKMMLEVHALRKTTDVVASPWQSKNDGQQRLRQVTYTVALPTNSFGPKVSHVTETQVMSELTVPGEYYSVDAEASNAGIPYAESFLVSNHWCLTRESCSETRLAVYTSVKYKKNMWGFMKSVIDKNACSGVEGLLQGIDSALQQEVTEHANMHQRTRRRRRRGTVKLESEVPGSVPGLMPAADVTAAGTGVAALKDKTKAKLPVNNILVNRLLGSTAMRPPALARPPALGSGTAALNAAWRDDSVDTTSMSWPNCRVLIMTFLLLLLLCTNLMLFWRLTKLEELVRLQPHYAALRGFMQLDPDVVRKEIRSDAMLQILQEQEVAHVKMTEDWRTRISEAETLLHQAEGMLRGLHATIPTEQSAASRALLERLRESSLSLQADIDSSVQTGPELPYNFNDLESDSSHSRHEL